MIAKFVVVLALAYLTQAQQYGYGHGGGAAHQEMHHAPQPYDFGYSVTTDDHTMFSQQEVGDEKGGKRGSYMIKGADGLYRMVEYVADENGFRAHVNTNEPGTKNQNPADVYINAQAAQATASHGAQVNQAAPAVHQAAPAYQVAPRAQYTRTAIAAPAAYIRAVPAYQAVGQGYQQGHQQGYQQGHQQGARSQYIRFGPQLQQSHGQVAAAPVRQAYVQASPIHQSYGQGGYVQQAAPVQQSYGRAAPQGHQQRGQNGVAMTSIHAQGALSSAAYAFADGPLPQGAQARGYGGHQSQGGYGGQQNQGGHRQY